MIYRVYFGDYYTDYANREDAIKYALGLKLRDIVNCYGYIKRLINTIEDTIIDNDGSSSYFTVHVKYSAGFYRAFSYNEAIEMVKKYNANRVFMHIFYKEEIPYED